MPVLSLAGCYTECRYKWLIRPHIHRNATASVDWIGKSAPVPLLRKEALHLFRWYTHTHTHPTEVEKIKAVARLRSRHEWRWRWKRHGSEMTMKVRWKLLHQNPRGERKKGKERENTHQHTWPGAGKPWKGQRKKNRRPTETGQDQRRKGEDGSAKTNLPKPNLSLPANAQDQNLPREGNNAWNRGPMGINWWNTRKQKPSEGLSPT